MARIINLNQLLPGQKGKIIRLEGGRAFQERANALGIRIGKEISLTSSLPLRGPVAIKIGNTEIALGRGMANKTILEVI